MLCLILWRHKIAFDQNSKYGCLVGGMFRKMRWSA
jgi:hypothetical protein